MLKDIVESVRHELGEGAKPGQIDKWAKRSKGPRGSFRREKAQASRLDRRSAKAELDRAGDGDEPVLRSRKTKGWAT